MQGKAPRRSPQKAATAQALQPSPAEHWSSFIWVSQTHSAANLQWKPALCSAAHPAPLSRAHHNPETSKALVLAAFSLAWYVFSSLGTTLCLGIVNYLQICQTLEPWLILSFSVPYCHQGGCRACPGVHCLGRAPACPAPGPARTVHRARGTAPLFHGHQSDFDF